MRIRRCGRTRLFRAEDVGVLEGGKKARPRVAVEEGLVHVAISSGEESLCARPHGTTATVQRANPLPLGGFQQSFAGRPAHKFVFEFRKRRNFVKSVLHVVDVENTRRNFVNIEGAFFH